jgi:hypothetical protein
MREIRTASNKVIKIYDELFDYHHRVAIMEKIANLYFKFSSSYDRELETQTSSWSCHSNLNPQDVDMFFIFHSKELQKEFEGYEPIRMWVNAATKDNDFGYHPDDLTPEYKSLLYYANISWDINWDGQTIWRSENLKDIEFISDYVPGRVVVFDSTIPHKPIISNKQAPTFRFTVNTIWKKI